MSPSTEFNAGSSVIINILDVFRLEHPNRLLPDILRIFYDLDVIRKVATRLFISNTGQTLLELAKYRLHKHLHPLCFPPRLFLLAITLNVLVG
jgi:hypothetical protein